MTREQEHDSGEGTNSGRPRALSSVLSREAKCAQIHVTGATSTACGAAVLFPRYIPAALPRSELDGYTCARDLVHPRLSVTRGPVNTRTLFLTGSAGSL